MTTKQLMKLAEKGRIIPPPKLSKFPQQVSTEIQQWDNIIAATHWDLYDNMKPDGADFYVGDEELGHIHLDGSIHLATNQLLKTALLKSKMANNFPYGKFWVCYDILTIKDVEHALFLFRLNYDRLKGLDDNGLLATVKNFRES